MFRHSKFPWYNCEIISHCWTKFHWQYAKRFYMNMHYERWRKLIVVTGMYLDSYFRQGALWYSTVWHFVAFGSKRREVKTRGSITLTTNIIKALATYDCMLFNLKIIRRIYLYNCHPQEVIPSINFVKVIIISAIILGRFV